MLGVLGRGRGASSAHQGKGGLEFGEVVGGVDDLCGVGADELRLALLAQDGDLDLLGRLTCSQLRGFIPEEEDTQEDYGRGLCSDWTFGEVTRGARKGALLSGTRHWEGEEGTRKGGGSLTGLQVNNVVDLAGILDDRGVDAAAEALVARDGDHEVLWHLDV